jgi:hypothetical protein
LVEFVDEVELPFDGGKREKHDLAKIGEGVGGADGHAVLRDGSEDLAEDIVDVGSGQEVAGDGGGEFGAKLSRFEELLRCRRARGETRSRESGCGRTCISTIMGREQHVVNTLSMITT